MSRYFNPPAPRGTGRLSFVSDTALLNFNPPAPRGTGRPSTSRCTESIYFNPPAPRGTGLTLRSQVQAASYFNPPAPRGTGPEFLNRILGMCSYFNPPAPRGTGHKTLRERLKHIHFNPPAPRGTGRNCCPESDAKAAKFQSTRPSRDGTKGTVKEHSEYRISIHPPLAGRDGSPHPRQGFRKYFNPPAPRGTGRRKRERWCDVLHYFNPPAPRGTGHVVQNVKDILSNFNPPAPRGTGPHGFHISIHAVIFQSTRPSRDGTQ